MPGALASPERVSPIRRSSITDRGIRPGRFGADAGARRSSRVPFGGVPIRRVISILAVVFLGVLVASPAEGGAAQSASCGVQSYSYAGLQANSVAHGVAATLVST